MPIDTDVRAIATYQQLQQKNLAEILDELKKIAAGIQALNDAIRSVASTIAANAPR